MLSSVNWVCPRSLLLSLVQMARGCFAGQNVSRSRRGIHDIFTKVARILTANLRTSIVWQIQFSKIALQPKIRNLKESGHLYCYSGIHPFTNIALSSKFSSQAEHLHLKNSNLNNIHPTLCTSCEFVGEISHSAHPLSHSTSDSHRFGRKVRSSTYSAYRS